MLPDSKTFTRKRKFTQPETKLMADAALELRRRQEAKHPEIKTQTWKGFSMPGPQAGPQEAFLNSTADIVIYGGAAGGGKGLALDTPIRTPSGYVSMGDLRVGDFVYDENGHSCKVTFVTDPVLRDCYLLTFDDGSTLLADDVHRWLTYDAKELSALTHKDPEWRARRRAKRPSRALGNKSAVFVEALNKRNAAYSVIQTTLPPSGTMRDTKEIFESLLTPSGRRNHAIQVAKTIELPEVELPLDPYLLGVWLGDGTTVNSTVSGIDEEIFDAFKRVGFKTIQYTYCVRNILGLGKYLRKVGVLGNKHIPDDYLFSSSDQRLALLQGLMDTDGTIAKDGQSQFTSTNKKLVDGVYDLVVSLGIKATVCEGRSKLYNKDYGPVWDVTFTTSMPVFRLDRKLTRLRKQEQIRRVSAFRYIVKCEPVPSVPTRCIAVDSPSHLYLAGKSLIPTHNTYALLLDPLRSIRNPGFTCVIFRQTYAQVTQVGGMWDETYNIYPKAAGSASLGRLEWHFKYGSKVAFAYLMGEKDKEQYAGAQITELCFDQLEAFSETQFFFMLARNRSMCKVKPRVRATCNPDADSWLAGFLAWWIDPGSGLPIPERAGVVRWFIRYNETIVWASTPDELKTGKYEGQLPKSCTFIPSTVYDNKILLHNNPEYLANLMALHLVDRERLLKGNWKIRIEAGKLFNRSWFKVVEAVPAGGSIIRYWDFAATEKTITNNPDFTAGVKIKYVNGVWYIMDVVNERVAPNEGDRLFENTCRMDSIIARQEKSHYKVRWEVEPGAMAKKETVRLTKMLAGIDALGVASTKDKVTRAKPLAAQCEAGNVYIVQGEWNEGFLTQLHNQPYTAHDDMMDAASGAFAASLGGGWSRGPAG
jgi:predicted phage terminase large subunit-like protein